MISEDTWIYITYIRNNNEEKIYINGVIDNTKTGAVDFDYSDRKLNFAILNSTSGLNYNYCFDGKLDDIRIYTEN